MACLPNDDILRKRLHFRCWHRGTRETDLLLGGFANRCLADLDSQGLAALDSLLAEDDPDIWDWALGRAPVPDHHDTIVMAMIRRDLAR